MVPFRMEQLSRLCGVLWILVVVTVATALAITLVYDITLNPDDIEKALQRVALHPLAHVTELVFDTLSDVLLLTVAALLYVVFGRRLGPMLGSLWFVAAAILLAAHNMGNFAFTWIAGKHAAAAAVGGGRLRGSRCGEMGRNDWLVLFRTGRRGLQRDFISVVQIHWGIGVRGGGARHSCDGFAMDQSKSGDTRLPALPAHADLANQFRHLAAARKPQDAPGELSRCGLATTEEKAGCPG